MGQPYSPCRVFASTFTYSYTKLRGKKWVVDALTSGDGFPAAETVSELRSAIGDDQFALYEDGQTLIARARCQAAGEFLRHQDCDVWLSFDDDAFVPRATLGALIETARATRGLVGAPGLNRLSNRPSYSVHGGPWKTDRIRTEGVHKLYRIDSISFTCVAIHRSVIESMAIPQSMVTLDNDHKPYPALFMDRLFHGAWVGEEIAFCMAMREHFLRCWLLLERPMTHAGVDCMVDVDGSVLLDAETAKRLAEAQGGSR